MEEMLLKQYVSQIWSVCISWQLATWWGFYTENRCTLPILSWGGQLQLALCFPLWVHPSWADDDHQKEGGCRGWASFSKHTLSELVPQCFLYCRAKTNILNPEYSQNEWIIEYSVTKLKKSHSTAVVVHGPTVVNKGFVVQKAPSTAFIPLKILLHVCYQYLQCQQPILVSVGKTD